MGQAVAVVGVVIELVALAISLGLTIYSYVKTADLSSTPASVGDTDLNVTHAAEGMPIPIIYGYVTLTGNIIWWKYTRDAEAGWTEDAEYLQISIVQAVCCCETELYDINIYRNDELWLEDGPAFTEKGTYYGASSTDWNSGDINNAVPELSGTGDPIETYASLLENFTWVYFVGLRIPRNQAACPVLRYQVKRAMSNGGVIGNHFIYEGTYGNPGYVYYGDNPANVIYDLLSNSQFGLGMLPSERLDIDSFSEANEYFQEHKLGINFVISEHVEVREIIAKIQSWVDCLLVMSEAGKYQIKILKSSDTPVATTTDDDFVEFVFHRKSWDDTYNDFRADYTPEHGWTRKTLMVKNEANIALTGSIRQKKIDLTAFCDRGVASDRLHAAMKRESYPYASAQGTTNLKFSHVIEGDVITINSAEYGINTQFRVLARDTTEIDQNKVKFQLMQMTEKIVDANYDEAADPLGTQEPGQLPDETDIENLTFPAFTDTSTARTGAFSDPENSRVRWGAGQEQSGYLTYDVDLDWSGDYRVVDGDTKIQLNPTTFADDIQANALGLLNIDVWEES